MREKDNEDIGNAIFFREDTWWESPEFTLPIKRLHYILQYILWEERGSPITGCCSNPFSSGIVIEKRLMLINCVFTKPKP